MLIVDCKGMGIAAIGLRGHRYPPMACWDRLHEDGVFDSWQEPPNKFGG